jgi:hypothetical protein
MFEMVYMVKQFKIIQSQPATEKNPDIRLLKHKAFVLFTLSGNIKNKVQFTFLPGRHDCCILCTRDSRKYQKMYFIKKKIKEAHHFHDRRS